MKIIKPWGYEVILEHNPKYMVKKLFMRRGCRCSLQYHDQKCETIYVVSGILLVYIEHDTKSNFTSLRPGSYITINPGKIHRMMAVEDCIYIEASTPEINDVKRLGDDYNRMDNN